MTFTRRAFLATAAASGLAVPGSAHAGLFSRAAPLGQGDRFAFLAGADGKVAAVDVEKGRLETVLELSPGLGPIAPSEYYDVLFAASPEEKSATAFLLGTREPGVTNDLNMHPDVMVSDPDDSAMAFGGRDGIISIWSMRSNAEVVRVFGLGPVTGMTFGRSARYLYAVQESTRELAVVDLPQGWTTDPIGLPGDETVALEGLSRSLDGGAGFVALPDRDAVALLDLSENSLYREIPVAPDPGRVYASSNGLFFLVPHRDGKAVTVLTGDTWTPLRSIDTGFPVAEVLTGWLDSYAYALPAEGTEAAIISLDTLQLVGRLDLGVRPGPGLVTADTRTVVLPLPDTGEVLLIDAGGQKITTRIKTGLTGLTAPAMAVSNNVCH